MNNQYTTEYEEAREHIMSRSFDLSAWVLAYMGNDWEDHGKTVTCKSNPSVVINRGRNLYKDYGTPHDPAGRGWGNGIDLLVYYYNFDAASAIRELSRDIPASTTTATRKPRAPRQRSIAAAANGTTVVTGDAPAETEYPPRATTTDAIIHYLCGVRGISKRIVDFAIDCGMVYQDKHSNAVFVGAGYGEIRGTDTERRFVRQCTGSKSDSYWMLMTGTQPRTAYICESAIDALSLCTLHHSKPDAPTAVYCSVGGASKYSAIDAIIRAAADMGIEAVLAVDSDEAGDRCARHYPDVRRIKPPEGTGKDWNDFLVTIKKRCSNNK